jgi:hypothetical protein
MPLVGVAPSVSDRAVAAVAVPVIDWVTGVVVSTPDHSEIITAHMVCAVAPKLTVMLPETVPVWMPDQTDTFRTAPASAAPLTFVKVIPVCVTDVGSTTSEVFRLTTATSTTFPADGVAVGVNAYELAPVVVLSAPRDCTNATAIGR